MQRRELAAVMHFHQWSRWEMISVERSRELGSGGVFEYSVDRQSRTCKKCGLEQSRDFD